MSDSLDSFLGGVGKSKDNLDDFLSDVKKPDVVQVKLCMLYWPNGCVRPRPQFLAEQRAKKRLTEDTGCTFEEWKELGYWIKKGEKSMFRSPLNEPLFTIEQVIPPR